VGLDTALQWKHIVSQFETVHSVYFTDLQSIRKSLVKSTPSSIKSRTFRRIGGWIEKIGRETEKRKK
jgi:hypothetical protein